MFQQQQHLEHKLEVVEENYNILKKKLPKKIPFPKKIAKVDQDTREEATRMKQKEGSFENHTTHKLERK